MKFKRTLRSIEEGLEMRTGHSWHSNLLGRRCVSASQLLNECPSYCSYFWKGERPQILAWQPRAHAVPWCPSVSHSRKAPELQTEARFSVVFFFLVDQLQVCLLSAWGFSLTCPPQGNIVHFSPWIFHSLTHHLVLQFDIIFIVFVVDCILCGFK